MHLLLSLLLAPQASAMQLELDDAQLCGLSDHVLVGEVTSSEVRWSAGPEGGIETHVWLAVDRVIHGPSVETVEVVLPGGQIGDLKHWVEDVPTLVEDHQYTLFLTETGMGNVVVGGDQGARFIKPSANIESLATALKMSVGACVAP